MSRDPTRVALAVLCVVSVVLAAALLPGAGLQTTRPNTTGSFGGLDFTNATANQVKTVNETVNVTKVAENASIDAAGIVSNADRTSLGGPLTGNGSGQLSARILFTVDADRPTYYRDGAYVTYTGSGWTRPDDDEPYDGEIYPDAEGERVVQTVTAKTPMTVAPAAWHPVEVQGDAASLAQVSGRGGISLTTTLSKNESYTVVSRVDVPSPSDLQTAGTAYPTAVESTYTQLPDSLPDSVAEKTDEIVANASADTPYEKARAIERWLETHKTYSLDARKPEGDFVAGFLFDMEEGYCQYFATSMVVMLRTEGIPARYVTGFTPGQPSADGEYVVRQMNAHAWVEVYFPGEGWVQFDPTPASDRVQEEQDTLTEARSTGEEDVDTGGTQNQTYPENETTGGSPGETPGGTGGNETGEGGPGGNETGGGGPGGNETGEGGPGGNETGGQTGGTGTGGNGTVTEPVTITLSEDPVPGAVVRVTVRSDGEPVSGVGVYFNGDFVGTTNASGQVVGRVPYANELNVSVGTPQTRVVRSVGPPPADGAGIPPNGVAGPPSNGRYYSVGPPPTSSFDTRTADSVGPPNGSDNSSRSYELTTDATISLDGTAVPGQTVTLTVAVDDVPVPQANVSIDGRFVGQTTGDGRLTVRVPYEESFTVRADRGVVAGERTVDVDANVSVDVRGTVTPGERARVVATVGDQPFFGGVVYVNGTRLGRTRAKGQLPFRVPFEGPLNVTVRRGDVGGTAVVPLDNGLNVNVSGTRFPGATLTVSVTVDGDPVEGATVTRGNETVAVTGANGQAKVGVPVGDGFVLGVRKAGLAWQTHVGGVLFNTALVGLLVVALVGVYVARRRYGVAGAIPLSPTELVGFVLAGVVSVAAFAASVIDELRDVVTSVAANLRQAASIAEFVAALPAMVAAGVRSRWLRLRRWALRLFQRPNDVVVDADEVQQMAAYVDEGPPGERVLRIEEAWKRMVGRLRVRNRDARTPGEFARTAVDDGLPRDAVTTLTDVFRDAKYGSRSPSESQERTATSAVHHIESSSQPSEEASDSDDTGTDASAGGDRR